MTTEQAKPERIATAVARAKEIVERAKLVNKAQFAHGISSTSANVEWWLRRIEKQGGTDYDGLQKMHDSAMKLAGYLYALKEGIL